MAKYANLKSYLLMICVIIVYVTQIRSLSSNDRTVDAPAGKFLGSEMVDANGELFIAFRGIPYAQPPVGDLRFEKPQPLERLDDVFDATKEGPECLTPALPIFNHYNSGVEDCLTLNIFTKSSDSSSSIDTNCLKKVIVFIHGGGFIVGSSKPYLPGTFINAHDIVVVTINYRTGILGFLSTEDEVSPGNNGLWDMILALRWVGDNIAAFGGDPADITVSGESAGGSAVSYLTLAPPAKNLFTKAYAQSGGATSVFGLARRAKTNALELATLLGCWDGSLESHLTLSQSREIIACLKKVPSKNFTSFVNFSLDESKFVPRIDGDIIPKDPLELMADSSYLRSVEFFDKSHLVALNNNERAIMLSHIRLNGFLIKHHKGVSEEEAANLIKKLHLSTVKYYTGSRLQTIEPSQKLTDMVFKWYSLHFGDHYLSELTSDLSFLMPSLDHMDATTRGATNSWLLYFDHYPQIMKGHQRGMPHGFDLMYWFDFPMDLMKIFLNDPGIQDLSEEDLKVKKLFSAVIASFVKNGDPSSALSEYIPGGVPRYDSGRRAHISLQPKPSLEFDLEPSKRELWTHFASHKEST